MFASFLKLDKIIPNEKGLSITSIRSDHGGEFKNEEFEFFCNENRVQHTFYTPQTPKQNRIMDRKTCSLEEIARTMLN